MGVFLVGVLKGGPNGGPKFKIFVIYTIHCYTIYYENYTAKHTDLNVVPS